MNVVMVTTKEQWIKYLLSISAWLSVAPVAEISQMSSVISM